MRAEAGGASRRLLSWGLAYSPAAALALLLPKCPLCIAAPLALMGVTVSLPGYARALALAASIALATTVMLFRCRENRGAMCGRSSTPDES